MSGNNSFEYPTAKLFRDATIFGIIGGIAFACFLPVFFLVAWGYVAFWVGSAFVISRKNASYTLIAAITPCIVAAAVFVAVLGAFTTFFVGDEVGARGWFGYVTAVGMLFAIPTALVAPKLEL